MRLSQDSGYKYVDNMRSVKEHYIAHKPSNMWDTSLLSYLHLSEHMCMYYYSFCFPITDRGAFWPKPVSEVRQKQAKACLSFMFLQSRSPLTIPIK